MERILAAAAVARLDKDVADFPRGYDTTVGERGITLSGGQKQRTAIARAVATDPRILILDDALSAVDTYTEEEILSRLRKVMSQRTAIIVSHRVSTVRDANQILVLDKGSHCRTRHARRARATQRLIRGAAPEAAARRGARGFVITWGSAPHPGSVACGAPTPRAAPSPARRARRRYAGKENSMSVGSRITV